MIQLLQGMYFQGHELLSIWEHGGATVELNSMKYESFSSSVVG